MRKQPVGTEQLGGQVSIPGVKADSIDESVKSPQQTQVEAMQSLFSDVTWEKVDVSGYGNYEYEATVSTVSWSLFSTTCKTLPSKWSILSL